MLQVLVVDDEKSIRATVSEFLQQAGYLVEVAADAVVAKEILLKQDIDIVVSDIILPKITGIELLESIRETSPNVQVILMTGEPNVDTASDAVRAGAFDYITKPITKEKITRVVRSAAKIKTIDDDRRRLELENLEYQQNLEILVEERTKALLEGELRLKTLINSTPDVIIFKDGQGKWLVANDSAIELFTLQNIEYFGKTDAELACTANSITKEVFRTCSITDKSAWNKKGATQVDEIIPTTDGKEKVFDTIKTPLFEVDGERKGLVIIGRDITERKVAENALKKSKERYSRLSNLTYEGILIHKDGIVLDVNSAFVRMTGYKTEEIVGKNIIQLLVPPKHHNTVFEMMKKDVATPYEIEGIRKDGEIFQIEIESSNIFYGDGEEGVRVTAFRDISQRKKNELEIQKLLNAIEQTPVSIVITNTYGNIEYVNPKYTEVTGYTFEEALNQNPRVLNAGKQPDEFYINLWETISSGNVWSGEFHNKNKNGELFWESAIISPVKDDEGKTTHYVSVKEDITEKKAMLVELINSKEQAENADKMKSIFLAQMSHEIRTPINAMVSISALLKDDFENIDIEEKHMSFDIIDRAGSRIIRTIDLLLNLSEIQAGTYEIAPTQFDIFSDVLSVLIAEYKKLAKKKNIVLSMNSSKIDTELVADSYTVNQIFTQLIDNAIKYTNEGEVTIKVNRNESDQLVVEIKDTGVGIGESYLSNIFEPFSQEEMGYTRKYEGNGIGLALVNKYCELNNAKLEVESKKGKGSTFRVIF